MADEINNPDNKDSTKTDDLPAGVPPAGKPPVVPDNAAAAPKPADGFARAGTIPAPELSGQVSTNIDLGDSVLNAAVSTLVATTKATEVDLERIAAKAIEYGDINLLDVNFIREKYPQFEQQFIAVTQAIIDQRGVVENFNRQQIYNLAGGEQNWNAAVSVFNANAPDYLRTAVRSLIDGGKQTEGAQLLMDYVQGSGLGVVQGDRIKSTNVSAGNGGLTKEQFQEEMQKLRKDAGFRSLDTGPYRTRYDDLLARRAFGRSQGM